MSTPPKIDDNNPAKDALLAFSVVVVPFAIALTAAIVFLGGVGLGGGADDHGTEAAAGAQ